MLRTGSPYLGKGWDGIVDFAVVGGVPVEMEMEKSNVRFTRSSSSVDNVRQC